MSSGRRLPARSQSLSHSVFLFSRCPSFFFQHDYLLQRAPSSHATGPSRTAPVLSFLLPGTCPAAFALGPACCSSSRRIRPPAELSRGAVFQRNPFFFLSGFFTVQRPHRCIVAGNARAWVTSAAVPGPSLGTFQHSTNPAASAVSTSGFYTRPSFLAHCFTFHYTSNNHCSFVFLF